MTFSTEPTMLEGLPAEYGVGGMITRLFCSMFADKKNCRSFSIVNHGGLVVKCSLNCCASKKGWRVLLENMFIYNTYYTEELDDRIWDNLGISYNVSPSEQHTSWYYDVQLISTLFRKHCNPQSFDGYV